MNIIFEVGMVTNPTYADADKTGILATVTFPNHPQIPEEGVPFLARADDPTEHGAQLWTDLNAGKYGKIAPYVPPKVVDKTTTTTTQSA